MKPAGPADVLRRAATGAVDEDGVVDLRGTPWRSSSMITSCRQSSPKS